MKTWLVVLLVILLLIILGSGGYFGYQYYQNNSQPKLVQQTPIPAPTPKPLEKFTFDNLSKRDYSGSAIEIREPLNADTAQEDGYNSNVFFFISDDKKVSGQINIPIPPTSNPEPEATDSAEMADTPAPTWVMPTNGKLPVIVMIRGFVDRDMYETGIGTSRAAGVLAANGYITLSLDFLGYGQSDPPMPSVSERQDTQEYDVWWERFNNPVQVLNLLASIKNLPQADPDKIGIWAHSNGGQIALSVLEISQKAYPTTLWAPVTKPFPFAILFFTDEFEDEGKALRAEVARLEKDYDVRQYSITDYLDRIIAPLQIHQGSADDAVPLKWSNEFVAKLKNLKKDYKYYTYQSADHNMAGSWNTVINRDLVFFEKYLYD